MSQPNGKQLIVSGYNTQPDRDRALREFEQALAPTFGHVQVVFNGRVGDRKTASSSTVEPEKARDFAAAVKQVIGPNPVTLTFTL